MFSQTKLQERREPNLHFSRGLETQAMLYLAKSPPPKKKLAGDEKKYLPL